MTSRAPRVDADNLVEDGNVGVLRGGDFAAKTAAVHDAPQVKACKHALDAVLGGQVEREGLGACVIAERGQ